jgi:signal transduction histidine kinase
MQDEQLPDVAVFLASSAHDMKNSLNMLSGRVERFLAELSPASFSGYQDLSYMLYEIKRINHGLIQLLALYKIGERLYPFDPQPILLTHFIDDLVALNSPLLSSLNIELDSACPEDLVWHFDEDLIGGVISQALNNAAHYTKKRIHLAVTSSNSQLEIRVEDDGPGFPLAMLSKTVSTPSKIDFNSGSTGLGLYFARTVAGMHKNQGRHGTLNLENGGAWGGGCFILQLP